ncbi:MAG: trigger factor [Gammaproteobacteria bacterium]|nr:trigger factor [Gammaproteobacteria bacterium]MCW9058241.1 trigger factor [Gammaproteobacteria bacterium]
MQVSVENTSALERRMTVQIPAEQVDSVVKTRLQSMTRTVRLDGFRPGKVPFKVVERKFGPQVRLEALGELISSTYQEAIQQQNLRPAGDPRIEPPQSEGGETLQYVATFEVYPEFEPAAVSAIKVTRPKAEVTDADVDGMLEKLRKQRVSWEPKDTAAALGDRVIIDFVGTIDGESFSGNKASNLPLELGSKTMIDTFEDQLVGAKAGEERSIEVNFPADYSFADVAGKPARFEVKISQVQAARLPELDDSFADSFGISGGGLQGLRAEVRRNMERELNQTIKNKVKRQVFDALMEQNAIDVPKALVSSEVDALARQAEQQGMQSGGREAFENEASRRVALGLIIGEIIRRNQLQVDPERVRAEVENLSASYEKPEEVVQYYYSNRDALAGVQSYVMEDIVMDWVLDQAQVTEESTTFDNVMQSGG